MSFPMCSANGHGVGTTWGTIFCVGLAIYKRAAPEVADRMKDFLVIVGGRSGIAAWSHDRRQSAGLRQRSPLPSQDGWPG